LHAVRVLRLRDERFSRKLTSSRTEQFFNRHYDMDSSSGWTPADARVSKPGATQSTTHAVTQRVSRFRLFSWILTAVLLWTSVFGGPLPAFLTPAASRTLYFKLPLEGVRFHWDFQDAAAFLAGELTLRIINGNRDETLVVFRDGKIHDGWEMIGDDKGDGSFYFGFATDDRVRTAQGDSLIITLTVKQDLLGRGTYTEGVLRAGTWQMTGTYSGLYGGRWNPMDFVVLGKDPPVAYMQCWDSVWPMEITKTEGWRGAKPANEDSVGFFRRMRPERGVDGRRCGSHI